MSTKLTAIVRSQLESAKREVETLSKERDVRQAEVDNLVAAAETESRDFDNREQARFREVHAQIREIDDKLGPNPADNDFDPDADNLRALVARTESRLAELVEAEQAKEQHRRAVESWAGRAVDVEQVGGVARVRSEPRTYNPERARGGVSFFTDVYARQFLADPRAAERLERHSREAQFHELAGYERRDVGTSAFSGLVVPQYLTDLVAPLQRAMAPTVAICNRQDLPDNGLTLTISRITTGTGVGAQSNEGSDSATETNADDTSLTVNVRTYAGMQDASRQALERGTMIESLLTEDLGRAYWTKVDDAILNADGTAGTHLGIRSTSSIASVSYAATTPAVTGLYPKLAELISTIQSGVFMGVTHFIMHPRRWWWIASALSSTRPIVHIPGVTTEQAGNLGGTGYDAMNRDIFGVPVVLDGNIPTTLGASTNEDVILGVTAPQLLFWHDNGPLFLRTEQTLSSTLQVRFVLYSYSAFTAGRYPGAHGTITSTGLATPSFA